MEIGKTTQRDQLLEKLSARTKLEKAELGYILIEFLDIVKDEIKKGKSVYLPGLGKFHFKEKKSTVSNLTGQVIPKHHQVRFKFNLALARYVRVMSRQI